MANVRDILANNLVKDDPRPEGEVFDLAGRLNIKLLVRQDPSAPPTPVGNVVEVSTDTLKKGK